MAAKRTLVLINYRYGSVLADTKNEKVRTFLSEQLLRHGLDECFYIEDICAYIYQNCADDRFHKITFSTESDAQNALYLLQLDRRDWDDRSSHKSLTFVEAELNAWSFAGSKLMMPIYSEQ